VLAGFVDGEQAAAAKGRPIVVRCLVTAMRHAARSREIAELAIRFRDKGMRATSSIRVIANLVLDVSFGASRKRSLHESR
jgi:hypothetical protein